MERKDYMGGSDIGKIAGLSPWGGPIDVFLEKTGRAPPRKRRSADQQGKIDWGVKLELLVLAEAEARLGMTVTPNREADGSQRTEVHRSFPRVAGTPDAFAALGSFRLQRGHLVEAKTAGFRQADRWGHEGTDQVPDEYLAQSAWYMEIFDIDHTHMPVLFDGHDFRLYELPRDRGFGEALLELGARFWRDHVEADKPPPAQTPEERLALAAGLFPRNIKAIRQSTPEVDALALELRELRRSSEIGSKREIELRAALVDLIQDSDGVEGPWGRIDFKRNQDSLKVDWESVARECFARMGCIPDLAEAIVQAHTTLRQGARPFTPRFKPGDHT